MNTQARVSAVTVFSLIDCKASPDIRVSDTVTTRIFLITDNLNEKSDIYIVQFRIQLAIFPRHYRGNFHLVMSSSGIQVDQRVSLCLCLFHDLAILKYPKIS